MDIKNHSEDKLAHSFQVSVAPETIEFRIKNRLLELGKSAKIPGFRPGKAPLQILQQRYEATARPEVIRSVIDDSYQQILTQNKLRPASSPNVTVDSYEENQALVVTYAFEVLPEIKEIDLTKIACERPTAAVTDKMIDAALTRLEQNNKSTAPLDKMRPAKMGDTIVIDFEGRTKNGPIVGGSAKGVNLELGSGYFIPGFENKIVGMAKGEYKTIEVSFPKDYNTKDLAGEDATFDVTVHDILKTVTPPIDDAFATNVGFKSLQEFREAIKHQLQVENDQMSFMVAKKAILDVVDKEKVDLPPSLVELEYKQIHPQANPEEGEKPSKKKASDEEDKKFYTIAERRVRLGLILADIGNRAKVEVTAKELQQAVMDQARRYPGQEKAVMEFYQKNTNAQQSLRAPIFEDKVIRLIIAKGNVKDKKVTQAELEGALKKVTDSAL
jgi:trigger factor